MTIKLTAREFESRLKELIRKGEPWIMGSPLGMFAMNLGSEPFYGQVDSSKFKFTNNSFLFPTGAVIDGTFVETDNGTIIDYHVNPMFFMFFMIRAFPILGVIIINAIMFTNSLPFIANIAATLFLGVAFLSWRWREKRGLKKLEKMFREKILLNSL